MSNNVFYRFKLKVDIDPTLIYKIFIKRYKRSCLNFSGIELKIYFDYDIINPYSLFIYGTCNYPYEKCLDDFNDYNIENVLMTGIDIIDIINGIDETQGKILSNNYSINAELDMVLINDKIVYNNELNNLNELTSLFSQALSL
jgi:hypothetical protein